MYSETEDLIRALAENAEGVCRAYLPAGRREGSYWSAGDLQNNPGRSLFVRLTGPPSGPGARGAHIVRFHRLQHRRAHQGWIPVGGRIVSQGTLSLPLHNIEHSIFADPKVAGDPSV